MSGDLKTRVKPPSLQAGDTVGIIAPASPIKRELLEAGCAALRGLGYKPFYLDSIFDQDIYFAGTAKRRARELQEMFERDEVRAIICARGGYGTNYLLDQIDIDVIRRNPKIFVGYSDVTTLMTWFMDQANLVTFHGPMVAKDFAVADGVQVESFQLAVGGADVSEITFSGGPEPEVKSIRTGDCEGILYGGCLSMLVASLGTPYEIDTGNTVLFIEDLATKPYQVDRMFMHLKLAGKLESVRGIIFGEMLDCAPPGSAYTLETVIRRLVADLSIPVIYGLRSGHVSRRNMTLPLGIRVALSAQARQVSLKFLEPATVPVPVAARSAKS